MYSKHKAVIMVPACGYLEQNESRPLDVFRQIEVMTAITDGVVDPPSSRIAQRKELRGWMRVLVTRKRTRECRCVRTGICPCSFQPSHQRPWRWNCADYLHNML